MSDNANKPSNAYVTVPSNPFPAFPSVKEVENLFQRSGCAWDSYLLLPPAMQQELMNFFTGKQGLKITYDTVFQKIFNPFLHPERLEAFLSAALNRKVKIIEIMPREGTQLKEQTSFVVMDVLVRLDDNSFANVEMQKIGYLFPLARADCYASDIIMRQYAQVKAGLGKKFSFRNLCKVYCIILMESSPKEFHTARNAYLHRRSSSFDTGIYSKNAGLHEDIFICLDSFRSIVHTITKDSTDLDAWLTFLSATEPETVKALIRAFPAFAPIYQEIADFTQKPEELINMLSEALYIMDKNTERLMVTELQEEVAAEKARADAAEVRLQEVLAFAREHGYRE